MFSVTGLALLSSYGKTWNPCLLRPKFSRQFSFIFCTAKSHGLGIDSCGRDMMSMEIEVVSYVREYW